MRRLENLSDHHILGVLLGAAGVGILLSALTTPDPLSGDWFSGLFSNFATEMVGAVLTFFMFETILGTRKEKERLIRDMGSQVNDIARRAVEEMHARGWLNDGTLSKQQLVNAQWAGVNLAKARLTLADLEGANLQGADLTQARLLKTNLSRAKLVEAKLEEAKLLGATLWQADLTKAILWGANLSNADLSAAVLLNANLWRADLSNAKFDEKTVLPDGTTWKPDADLGRFTDAQHVAFWQPPAEDKN